MIDPATTTRTVLPPDVILTLPDGQTVTLTGFVDLTGASAGGLAGADGSITVASSLEALSAPAAGGAPAGADSAGDNNISTYNQALLGALGGAFGAGTPFDGLDPAVVLASLLESPDPNEFLAALLDTLGVVTPATTTVTTTPATTTPTTDTGTAGTDGGTTTTDGGTTPTIVGLAELFTPGNDTVDLSDIAAVLTQAGLDPTDPAALGVFLLAVAAGFNISDALAGDDAVQLPGPGDNLFGLVGSFEAGGGNDTITGGTGNDSILGDIGEDTLYGDDGEDQLDGGIDADVIYGDDGTNPLGAGVGDADTLLGGSDGDTLYGEQGTDLIYGDSDQLGVGFGQGEGDRIYGGLGDDTAYGGDDRDRIFGGEGNDLLYGDDGDNLALQNILETDSLFGGLGEDTLYGEEERDTLAGGDDTDTMFGGSERDLFLVDATDSVLNFADVNRIEDFHDGGGTGSGEVVEIFNAAGLDILVGNAGLVGGDAGEAIVFQDQNGNGELDATDLLIVFLDDVLVADAVLGTDVIIVP